MLKSKKGMTMVELLVALSLLMLIIMSFTPMLLKSYETLYKAGEKTEETYNVKSKIEEKLSIRENDPLVNNGAGITVKFRALSNALSVQARRIASTVPGLETLYGLGKAQLRIISETTMADNQSYFPVTIRLVNFDATSVVLGSTWNKSNHKQLVLTVESTMKSFTFSASDLDTSRFSKGIIKINLKDVDITYSPFKLTAYYYDEYDQPRIVTNYVYITASDIMLVGKSTSQAQYLTSAGVDEDGKMLIAGRKMYDKAITAGTKINRVRWVTSNIDDTSSVGAGTYAMCGMEDSGKAFIRRLWNLNDELGATYSEVYDSTGIVFIDGVEYFKYIWGSDYTQPVVRGWIRGSSTDKKWDEKLSISASYDNVISRNAQNTFEAGTNYLMQLGKSYSAEYMSEYANSSGDFVSGKIIKNTNNNLLVTYGCQFPNLVGGDGYSGINLSSTGKRYNGWMSYIDYSVTGLENNISSTQLHNGVKKTSSNSSQGEYSDPTKKIARNDGSIVNSNHYFNSSSPIIFFASDGSNDQTKIDRYFIAKDNYWGSQLENQEYGGRYKEGFIITKWVDGASMTALGWVKWDPSRESFVSTGSEPRDWGTDKDATKIWDYYNEYHNNNNGKTHDTNGHVIYQKYIFDDISNGISVHWDGWSKKNNEHKNCWICDDPVKFIEQVRTNDNKYVIESSDSFELRRQKIMDLILDNMGVGDGDRMVIKSTVDCFVGDDDYTGGDKDERCNFVRLKSFTNLNSSFNDNLTSTSNITVDKSLTLSKEKNKLNDIGFNDNSNRSSVELTDVFFMRDSDDDTLDVVYTGVTPVSSIVYSPYMNSAGTTNSSNSYTIYYITSYGDDGYAIFQKNEGKHDEFKNITSFNNSFWSGKRLQKTASYTLGYSSNYNFLYGSLADPSYDNYSNKVLSLKTPSTTADFDNKLDGYTKDFLNITTFTESEGFTFAVGYKVIGYAGVQTKVISATTKSDFVKNYEAKYKKELEVNNIYYATTPSDFFTSDNFGIVQDSAKPYTTYRSDMKTTINESSAQENLYGFYFDARDNQKAAFVTSFPVSGVAWTALTNVCDTSNECNAVANEGLIEYMNPGDSVYTQLNFNFASAPPQNYKFTSVGIIKSSGSVTIIYKTNPDGSYILDEDGNRIVEKEIKNDDDGLDLVLAASNGKVYHGTLSFTITVENELDDKGNVIKDSDGNPVTYEVAKIAKDKPVTLYEFNCENIENVRTVCTHKYATEISSGSTVTEKEVAYIFASGKQSKNGTTVYISTDKGSTWTPVTISDTTYDIYDIEVIGDYVYAVGTNKAGDSGIVFYIELSKCKGNNWKSVLKYSTEFKSTIETTIEDSETKEVSDTAITGTDSHNLPPIYSLASKNA